VDPNELKKMMDQAQKMQVKMGNLQDELASLRFEADSGAGMIKAVATGEFRIVEIRIEEEVFARGDRDLIQDLTAAAVNAAITKAQQHVQTKIQQFSLGGLNIPNMTDPGGEQ
jgi:DNA-binding YbaB/EbfC family protein